MADISFLRIRPRFSHSLRVRRIRRAVVVLYSSVPRFQNIAAGARLALPAAFNPRNPRAGKVCLIVKVAAADNLGRAGWPHSGADR